MNKDITPQQELSRAQISPAESASVVAINPLPIGAIITYGSVNPPEGWLLCDGASLDEKKYENLIKVVGKTLPDLRGRFVVGAGAGVGVTKYNQNDKGGAENVTLTLEQIPPHRHYGFGEYDAKWPMGVDGDGRERGSHGGLDNDNYFYGTTESGGGKSHENRPPYWALTYIIKF
jgi:microcystin-dependent protein